MAKRGFFLCALMFCLAASAHAETYRLLAGGAEDSVLGFAAGVFKNQVENGTQGRMRVEIIYDEEADEVFGRVKAGEAAFGIGALTALTPRERRLVFPALPGLFEKSGEIAAATSGEAGEILQKYAREAGFQILAWIWEEERFLLSAGKPESGLSDVPGMKIAAPEEAAPYSTLGASGAAIIPLSSEESEAAFRDGRIDGRLLGVSEASRRAPSDGGFLIRSSFGYAFQPLVANAHVFSRLPENFRKVLMEAGANAQRQARQFQEEAGAAAFGVWEAAGLAQDSPPGGEEWPARARRELWPDLVNVAQDGPALNDYLKAAGKAPLRRE